MKDRPVWNTTARDAIRRDGHMAISIDLEHTEVTLRTPPGETGRMKAHEVRELIDHLNDALAELERLA